jgi:hypothetical protein
MDVCMYKIMHGEEKISFQLQQTPKSPADLSFPPHLISNIKPLLFPSSLLMRFP